MSAKPPGKKRGFWRRLRVYFRRFRIAVWLVLLTLLGCVIYVDRIGLPDCVKNPLLQKLRDRGVDLQFSRLRLRWYEGIIAEGVRFGQPDQTNGPQLTLKEVRVVLGIESLSHPQLQVRELALRHGQFAWRVEDGPAGREIRIEDIQAHLRFLPGDEWSLNNFTADFVNAKIQLAGTVTNASAATQWQFFHGPRTEPASAALWQKRLTRIAETLDSIHFSATPELRVNVQGDARSLASFTVRLALSAPGAQTPWGDVSGGRFSARLFAADPNGTSRADLDLEAADAQTRWASITNFHLQMRLASLGAQTNLIQGDLDLSTEQAHTRWASGSNVVLAASWVHSVTNPVPVSGHGRLQCAAAHSQWASGRNLELSSRLALPDPASLPACDDSWTWWTNLHPYALEWQCALGEVTSSRLCATNLACDGDWRAPRLNVSNLVADLCGGRMQIRAGLDVASRRLNTALKSDVNPHGLEPVLPASACAWLDQFTWTNAPRVEGSIAVTLPAWTNREPDWQAEVVPTLALDGAFDAASGGTYRGVQVSSARSHFTYSNMTWHLPDLTLTRSEGGVVAEHRANERTRDFFWHVSSSVSPEAIRHLLSEGAQQGLDLVKLSQPPLIDARIWGRSRAPELTGVRASVSLTNFSFRGETATGLQTELQYTNKLLLFMRPRIQRGSERIIAEAVTVDLGAESVYLAEAFSTADPMVVARAIGEKIGRTIEPYVFTNPPTAHVWGTVPLHGEEGADLHFRIEGGPFHWWRINVPWIVGDLHWEGLSLTMRDVRARFYHGEAGGFADFKFPRGKGCEFTCSVAVTNSTLQDLMADLSTATNRLEGTLNGTMNFTHAEPENWNALMGYGEVRLHDGLIWDIPLFGVFTPVLNGIAPGLGTSRASAGTATYYINNGVIRTDDLEIRSPAMRLKYRGTVDLESRVNAKVDAELLRDMWLVGPMVSTVLWPVTKMFEYRVTGTLGEPKTEPVYIIPKIIDVPFLPFRILKGLMPESPAQPPRPSPSPPPAAKEN